MTVIHPRDGQPQESHPPDWQPCPLCEGKGGIVRFADGVGTVAVRYVCGYCNGSGIIRTTGDNHD